jgi:hypothetical protein
MTLTASQHRAFDRDANWKLWRAVIPFAGTTLLASVGVTLSVLFRIPVPALRSHAAKLAAMLYVLALVPVPVLISCLLAGYSWARSVLALLLLLGFGMTVVNCCVLLGREPRLACGVLPFLVPQLLALRLVHGARLRRALAQLAAQRERRWGSGFGWFLVAGSANLCVSAVVSILLILKLKAAGGPDLTNLPGLLRLLPPGIGMTAAATAIARIPHSRWPARGLLIFGIVVLAVLLITDAATLEARLFYASTAALAAFGLVGLARSKNVKL